MELLRGCPLRAARALPPAVLEGPPQGHSTEWIDRGTLQLRAQILNYPKGGLTET